MDLRGPEASIGGLVGVCWGSEVLEGPKGIGEDPQGAMGGLLGVRGPGRTEGNWREHTGVSWGSEVPEGPKWIGGDT